MACGLGAVVLVFMLVKHNVGNSTNEIDLLQADVQLLQEERAELQQTLEQLQTISMAETENITRLRSKLASLEQSIQQRERSLVEKKEDLAALEKDISTRPIARKDDLIEDDRGGEEHYLMGLKVQGPRIAVLVDSSGSMTDEKLIDVIKRKNGSKAEKKKGPKWLRTRKTVRWLLARVPRTSQIAVLSFNGSVNSLGQAKWLFADKPATLTTLYHELENLTPEGPTNLQKGLQAVSKLGASDLYIITDGLPTVGESRYTSLNPFSNCSSLLGKASTISGECRVKLFRQSVKESNLQGMTVNVILLPIEGDPDAVNEYWAWAAQTGGLVISPAGNWP